MPGCACSGVPPPAVRLQGKPCSTALACQNLYASTGGSPWGLEVEVLGSVAGTVIGLGFAYILQTKGIDIGAYMQNASMMLPNVLRANITPSAYYIGFFPGLVATVLGAALSGLGIYKRKTAQLFKELET